MHKFYWNNSRSGEEEYIRRKGVPDEVARSNIHKSVSTRNEYNNRLTGSSVPDKVHNSAYSDRYISNISTGGRPVYSGPTVIETEGTVCVSVTNDNERATDRPTGKHPPTGSHRVLLKLRGLNSGPGNRPKSVNDLGDLVTTNPPEQVSEESVQSKSGRVQPAKSPGFSENRNKTWNLNTLRQYDESCRVPTRPSVLSSEYLQHNYENVYGREEGQEALLTQGISTRQNTRICKLSQSPRSLRTRRSDFIHSLVVSNGEGDPSSNGVDSQQEIQNSRKGRSKPTSKHLENKTVLYRSKSCERMKETMKDTLRIPTDRLQNNLSKFSNNISDKINSFQVSSRMSTTSTGSTDRQSSSSDEGKPRSPASWDVEGRGWEGSEAGGRSWERRDPNRSVDTPTQSRLQSVAYKAIPCVELQSQCKGGRVSPTDSIEYTMTDESKEVNRPALSLAHRMRGKLHTVNKKISMIRSRSAERFNSRNSGETSSEPIPVRIRKRHKSTGSEPVYEGPFIGHAKAIVDYNPSPYDRDALRFKKDDIIDIISMNASGLWRGQCGGKVGNFKFINVEILPPREGGGPRSRNTSLSRNSRRRSSAKPRSVQELLKQLSMEDYIPVFVLNGYENMTLFQDLDEGELDYLGIQDPQQRAALMAAADSMFQDGSSEPNSFSRSNLRDSGCYEDTGRLTSSDADRSEESSSIHSDFNASFSGSEISENNKPQSRGRQMHRKTVDIHMPCKAVAKELI